MVAVPGEGSHTTAKVTRSPGGCGGGKDSPSDDQSASANKKNLLRCHHGPKMGLPRTYG